MGGTQMGLVPEPLPHAFRDFRSRPGTRKVGKMRNRETGTNNCGQAGYQLTKPSSFVLQEVSRGLKIDRASLPSKQIWQEEISSLQ